MPATPNEIATLKRIISEELPEISVDRLQQLARRLDFESGSVSNNSSYKKTLHDFRLIYEKPKMVSAIIYGAKILLFIKIIFHFLLIFTNFIAVFFLPIAVLYQKSWTLLFIAVPICVYIVNIFFTNMPCSLTKLENNIRSFLGMEQIGTFCGHYILKPLKKLFS